ncbi:MAG TPA: hypothetical protein VFI19_03680 [Nocardioides sp.]|nr:hypothetical protein [Nocardioides sp.]
MNDAPLGFELALGLTRTQVNSARPDAPVVPDRHPRPPHRVRVGAAAALRRMAHAIEPGEPAGTAVRT